MEKNLKDELQAYAKQLTSDIVLTYRAWNQESWVAWICDCTRAEIDELIKDGYSAVSDAKDVYLCIRQDADAPECLGDLELCDIDRFLEDFDFSVL